MLSGDPKAMSEEQVSAFYVPTLSTFSASKNKYVSMYVFDYKYIHTHLSVSTKLRKTQNGRLKPSYCLLEAIIVAMSLSIFLHQGFERFVSILLTVIP